MFHHWRARFCHAEDANSWFEPTKPSRDSAASSRLRVADAWDSSGLFGLFGLFWTLRFQNAYTTSDI